MPKPIPPTPASRRWIPFLLAVAIAAATLALFWPATECGFLNFDDDRYVSNNLIVQQGLTLPGVRWAFTSVYELWWLPLLWISYMADTSFFGPGPFGYHLANILLHALNAALLFWVLFRMTGSRWRSAFVAALFAFHPLRVESVAWITERKDVLSGVFFFLCLLAHLRWTERPSPLRFWILQLLMLLGLMAKSILVVLPFLLLLLDYWPLRRASALWGRGAWTQWRPLLLEKTLLFVLSAVFVAITLATHGTTGHQNADWSIWSRLTLVAPNYGNYLAQIFWPARLSIVYPVSFPPVLLRALAAAGLLGITFLFWRLRAKHPALLVGWLWFLAALAPVIRGIRFDEQSPFSDRYTYLPAIGLAIALAWTAADLLSRVRRGRTALPAALALVLLAACAARTRAAFPAWKDSLAAFENVLKHAPDHVLSNTNYGEHLLGIGQTEQALVHLERAAGGGDPSALPFSNLGMALLLLDRPDEAIRRMEAARAQCRTDLVFLDYTTALAWMQKNDPKAAIPFFLRALQTGSPPPTWRAELARAYREDGQLPAYSNELSRIAAAGFPNLSSYDGLCLYYLGLWQHGHGRRSWTFFQRELEKDPDNVNMLNNAAWFLAFDPPAGASPADALRLAQKAHDLAGDANPGILDTLALAHAANGQFDDAIRFAEKAQAIARSQGMEDFALQIEIRLQAFRAGRMWRPPAPAP